MRTVAEAHINDLCLDRFEELKSDYPEHSNFFDNNKEELLYALQDIKTEKEFKYLDKLMQLSDLPPSLPYQYLSSSVFAAEDAMIELIDIKRECDRRIYQLAS